jgi:hypothetical protein
MKPLHPTKPLTLDPLATELLEGLSHRPEAAQALVLGGYFALKHYVDYRPTHDVDAWWKIDATPAQQEAALMAVRALMHELACTHNLGYVEKTTTQHGVATIALTRDNKAIFSFQIAPRDVQIETPVGSPWPNISIETLRDNIASKMVALVERGAPRDFRDIYILVTSGVASREECWALWECKKPTLQVADAKLQVLKHLASIELRRPLESISDPKHRAESASLRSWVRTSFAERSRDREQPEDLSR